jgi:ketosteroid isomerase-like protein
VRKVLSGLSAADNAGDLDAVLGHYSDDAILLPPNSTLVVGQPSIRAWYEAGLRRFRFEVNFDADEIQASGDWSYVRGFINGRLVPKGDDAPRKLHEKYIMVLRRHKEGWKIARVIWNASETPAPTTK